MYPDIYLFNPTCELAVANGSPNYTPPAHLLQLENDLGYLPFLLTKKGDQLLVKGLIDADFNEQLVTAGFLLPDLLVMEEALHDDVWISKSKGRMVPWGWSPATYHTLRNVLPSMNNAFHHSPVASWQTTHKELYSRKKSLEILMRVLSSNKSSSFVPMDMLPVLVTSLAEVEPLKEKWNNIVIKAPWSSSGRGLIVLPNNKSATKNREAIQSILKQQGYCTVSPWHNKLQDLSFQFESRGNGTIEYRGLTLFETDKNGQFQGNFIEEMPLSTDSEITDFIKSHHGNVVNCLSRALIECGYVNQYSGWIGIDAIVYRSENGLLVFHPCLEVNCRMTMGAVSIRLREHMAETVSGQFKIFYGAPGMFGAFCELNSRINPVRIENSKICSGFLPLTPFTKEGRFGAYMVVKLPYLG